MTSSLRTQIAQVRVLLNSLWEPPELTEIREERKCVFLCGGLMNPLSRHDHKWVGLNQDWVIADVQFDVHERTLTLPMEFVGDCVVCPECGAASSMKDHAVTRSRRHLDAMRFQTIPTARVPRCTCETCGTKTIAVPWADKHTG